MFTTIGLVSYNLYIICRERWPTISWNSIIRSLYFLSGHCRR